MHTPAMATSELPIDWTVPIWLKRAFLGLGVLSLAVLAASQIKQKYGAQTENAASSFGADALDGQRASDFSLPVHRGGAIQLGPQRGKLVLVNFWATWCPPCREEEPGLDRLSRVLDPASFEIIAISADDGWDPINKYFGAREPGYAVAWDEDASVRNRWGTSQFPETYLVDASGALRFKVIGARDWTSPESMALLEQMGARRR